MPSPLTAVAWLGTNSPASALVRLHRSGMILVAKTQSDDGLMFSSESPLTGTHFSREVESYIDGTFGT